MAAYVGGHDATSLELRRTRIGAWQIDADVDTSEKLSGSIVVEIDGTKWTGTVLDSHVYAGKCHAWIVNGAGGLQKELEAQQYTSAKLGDIARDILVVGGESVSSAAQAAALSRSIPSWERAKGNVANALVLLCDRAGVAWRGMQDGTFWFGADAWTEVSPNVIVINEDWGNASILLAPETDFSDVASLEPGSMFQGHHIEQVTHYYSSNSLRTLLQTSSAASEMNRFLEPLRRELDYSAIWECEVVAQNSDGTLQLSPVDKRMQGNGLDKVPIITGTPGWQCKVQKGAVAYVQFSNRDPMRPRVFGWKEGDTHVTSVEFKPGGSGAPACKVGDVLDVVFPMGLPITTSLGPAVVTITTPAKATIVGPGNPKVLL